MKPVIVLASLIASTSAMALDFDTEWAKFADDFARFRPVKVAKAEPVVTVITEPAEGEIVKVDPKSPDRLGLKLSDPAMREKVTSLYQKPDTVVYATTIR
jgi:hypothetical protein